MKRDVRLSVTTASNRQHGPQNSEKLGDEAILGGAPSSQTPGANNGCYIRSINVIWISPAEIWRSGKQEPAAADHTEESHLCDFTVSPSFMQVSQKYSEFVENRVYFYLN